MSGRRCSHRRPGRGANPYVAQFPGLAQQVHGEPLAYLDNAATTHMPQAVIDAVVGFELRSRANIHRGVHTLSQRATDAFDDARATLKPSSAPARNTSWSSPRAPPKR